MKRTGLDKIARMLERINASRREEQSAARHSQLRDALRILLDSNEELSDVGLCFDILNQESLSLLERGSAAESEELEAGEIDSLSTELERLFSKVFREPETRLAAYGTLRPGEMNYCQVAEIAGTWSAGQIKGRMGRFANYPMFRWSCDDTALGFPVQILESNELPRHWWRLDEFEGDDYERILVPVQTDDFIRICYVYNARIGLEFQ